MTQAIEMVRFTPGPEAEEALVSGRPGMLAALSDACPGMVRAYLGKTGASDWLDVIVWESRELALDAAAKAPEIPACAAWFSHIEQVVGMEHADVVAGDA